MYCKVCNSLYMFSFNHGLKETKICLRCGMVYNENRLLKSLKNWLTFDFSSIKKDSKLG